MVTKEEIKKERTKKKAALTRMGSKVRRLIAEKNQEEVKKCVDEMRGLYLDFEAKHDELYEMLDEDDELNECEIVNRNSEGRATDPVYGDNEFNSLLEYSRNIPRGGCYAPQGQV